MRYGGRRFINGIPESDTAPKITKDGPPVEAPGPLGIISFRPGTNQGFGTSAKFRGGIGGEAPETALGQLFIMIGNAHDPGGLLRHSQCDLAQNRAAGLGSLCQAQVLPTFMLKPS